MEISTSSAPASRKPTYKLWLFLLVLSVGLNCFLGYRSWIKNAPGLNFAYGEESIKSKKVFTQKFDTSGSIFQQLPTKNMQNPLVILVACSDYTVDKTPNLPYVRKDVENIKRALGKGKEGYKGYNYKIVSCENPSKRGLDTFLKNQVKYLQAPHNHDGLIFIYSGHGKSGTVELCDGKQMQIPKIKNFFNGEALPKMAGMKRIFIFDSCRGGDVAVPVVGPDGQNRHPEADFFTIHANSDDYQAFGDDKNGSHLICELSGWALALKDDGSPLKAITTGVANNVQFTSGHRAVVSQEDQSGYKTVLKPNTKYSY